MKKILFTLFLSNALLSATAQIQTPNLYQLTDFAILSGGTFNLVVLKKKLKPLLGLPESKTYIGFGNN